MYMRVKKWEVRVWQDHASVFQDYVVFATSGLDARILAFALNCGFSPEMVEMEAGHVELAKTYTEIVAST